MNTELREDDFAFVYLDVESPPIAWLAYRGIINSCDVKSANPGNLSVFLIDVVQRGLNSTLRREGLLEGFRQTQFSDCISRLKCIYAWPTLQMAKNACYGRGKFQEQNLVAIRPVDEKFKRQEYDSTWITDFDSLPASTATKYWSGEKSKTPQLECLLTGRFSILGTTVRKRAYETIKRTNPNSLAMLELSRLAVDFNSDLGSSSPWIANDGNNVIATYIIKYTEEEGLEIFEKALREKQKNPDFVINWVDIEPLCKSEKNSELDARFSVPDMRSFSKTFRADKFSDLSKFARLVISGEVST